MSSLCLRRDEQGMSLVELIVTMGIAALLLGIIAAVFGQGLGAQQQASGRNSVTARTVAQTTLFNETMRDAVAVRISPAGDEVVAKMLRGSDSSTAAVICRAWELHAGSPSSADSLRYREWQLPSGPPDAWTVLDADARLTTVAGAGSPTASDPSNLELTIYADGAREPQRASATLIPLLPQKIAPTAGGACW